MQSTANYLAAKALIAALGRDAAFDAVRKLSRTTPFNDVLSKSRSDDLDKFSPAAVGAARALIGKLGFAAAVESIKSMRQHEATGFYSPLIASRITKSETPPAPQLQGSTKPSAILAAEHARHQSHTVDPFDGAATHNEHLKRTANAHADLLASMRTALANPSRGPVPVNS